MTKVQVKNIFYTFNLVVNQMLIYLVLQYLCGKNMTLKPSSLIMMLLGFNMELARDLGLEKDHTIWE